MRLLPLIPFAFFTLWVQGQELPANLVVRFIRACSMGLDGSAKVACSDGAMSAEFQKAGVAVEDGAKLAWASNEKEVQTFVGKKKIVVCSNMDWVAAGAAIVLAQVDGKFKIRIKVDNAKKSGHQLPEVVLKISEPIP